MMFWRQQQDPKRRKTAQEIVVSFPPCECVSYGEWTTVALLVLSESLLSMDCVADQHQNIEHLEHPEEMTGVT